MKPVEIWREVMQKEASGWATSLTFTVSYDRRRRALIVNEHTLSVHTFSGRQEGDRDLYVGPDIASALAALAQHEGAAWNYDYRPTTSEPLPTAQELIDDARELGMDLVALLRPPVVDIETPLRAASTQAGQTPLSHLLDSR